MAVNEYDKLLDATPLGASDEGNEYDNLVQQEPAWRQSIMRAKDADPQKRVQAEQLGKKQGLPADTVERNLDKAQERERLNEYDRLLADAPETAKFLADPNNAKVARDDVETIGHLERLAGLFKGGYYQQQASDALGGAAFYEEQARGARDRTEVIRGPDGIPRKAYSVHAYNPGQAVRSERTANQLIGEASDYLIEASALPQSDVLQRFKEAEGFMGTVGVMAGDPFELVGDALASSGYPLIKGLAAGTVGGLVAGPGGAAAGMGGASFDSAYQSKFLEALEVEGNDPEALKAALSDPQRVRQARAKSIRYAAPIAVMDALGARIAGVNLASTPTRNIAAQTGVQVATGAGGEALGSQFAEGEIDWKEVTLEGIIEAPGGVLEVGMANANVHLAKMRDAAQAVAFRNRMNDAVTTAQSSKLRELDPERFRNLSNLIMGEKQVRIDADAAQTFFQDHSEALAAIDSTRVRESLALGSDVVLPAADYLTYLADFHDQLGDHIAVGDQVMTGAEAEQWQQQAIEQLTAAEQASLDPEEQAALDSAQQVREDIIGQLEGAGFERGTAEAYGKLYESTFRALGERTGTDPMELFQRYGLTVGREIPGVLQQRPDRVDELDAVISRLRTGDIPQDRDLFGPSLGEWLREQGVSDDGGELSARDVDVGKLPGQRNMAREDGRTLDDLAEQAVELGYIPERDPDLLLAKLDEELAGNPVYASEGDPNQVALRDTLNELADYLDQSGINLGELTDEQVKRLLTDGQMPEGEVDPTAALYGQGASVAEAPWYTEDPRHIAAMREYFESNGVTVNNDNTVTLWHATDPDSAAAIRESGTFRGGATATGGMTGLDLEPSAFFGTDREWVERAWGAGREVMEVRVPVQYLRHPAQNFKEIYFEGGLVKEGDTWRPARLRSTFVDRLANRRHGSDDLYDEIEARENGQQYDQGPGDITKTPEFRRWFGDSKVVDENGEPLVVYHRTDADFEAFRENPRGIFFADTEEKTRGYTRQGEGRTIPAYLRIENPWNEIEYGDDVPYTVQVDQSVGALKERGFDGIHRADGVWVAFHPEQVKSATANRGTFDPNDPRIIYQAPLPPPGPVDPAAAWEQVHAEQAAALGLDETQTAALAPSPDTDPLTGLYTDNELLPAIERAAQVGGYTYVEADLFNLGGLNKAMGANAKADAVLAEIGAAFGQAFPLAARRSGGRFGALVQGDPTAALEGVQAKVEQIVEQYGLADIEAPRVAGEKGVRLYSGHGPVGENIADTIGPVQDQITAKQPEGDTDEQRQQAISAWLERGAGRPAREAAREAAGAGRADRRGLAAIRRAAGRPVENAGAFAQPDAYRDQQHDQLADRLGLNESQREAFRTPTRRDPLTGFFTDADRLQTLTRAQQTLERDGTPFAYAVADIGNLGGMNDALGHQVSDTVFSEIAAIVHENLGGLGDVVPFRHGGDELSFVVVGADEATTKQALNRAQAEVRAYVRALGLNDLPHPKSADKQGVGIYTGTAPAAPTTVDPGALFDRADAAVERAKNAAMGPALARAVGDTTLFQGERGPRLSALHNLTTDNLLFADQIGGMPLPSIGIVREDMGIEGYGDITLIGRKELGDPEQVPAFDADAYTVTFPQPEYKRPKVKEADRVNADLTALERDFGGPGMTGELFGYLYNNHDPQRAIEYSLREPAIMARFIRDELGGKGEAKHRKPSTVNGDWTLDPDFIKKWEPFWQEYGRDGLPSDNQEAQQAWQEISDEARAAITREAERVVANSKRPGDKELIKQLAQASEEAVLEDGILMPHKMYSITRDTMKAGTEEFDRIGTREGLETELQGHEAEFKQWLENKILPIFGDPRLTVSGRKVPYDLENIVRKMGAQNRRAAEDTMTFGPGKARAAAAHRFTDVEAMREAADQIAKREDVDKAREESEKLLEDYRIKVADYFTIENYRGDIDVWEAMDSSMRALAKWAKSKKRDKAALRRALKSEDFNAGAIPDEVMELGQQAGEALLTAPVPYFEAKPARGVTLDEFAGAVVPDDVDPRAVEVLEKHGIPYRKYGERFDEEARTKAVTEFRQELADKGEEVLFQRERGYIRFGPERQFDIQLLKNADLSTFLHETGHFFLEVIGDLAVGGGPIADDYQTLLDWFGVESRDQITVEQHEQFARGFEAYLREGKAPSEGLRGAFAKFRAWLLALYRSARQLRVDLTDEVRGVMDRMVATDEEIQAAQAEQGFAPIFDEAPEGMSQRGFEAYREAVERARSSAEEEVAQRAIREVKREQETQWRTAREKGRKEVAKEVNSQPVYIAEWILRWGKMPDGSDVPEAARDLTLNKDALLKFVEKELGGGADFLKTRLNGLYRRTGGVSPEVAAELLGFDSARDMVMQLANRRKRTDLIEAETDARMREREGDLRMGGEAQAAALAAVHSDARAEVLLLEVKQLSRGKPVSPLSILKREAERLVAGKTARELRPDIYLRAEAKAGRQAFEALATGDTDAAFTAKQRQLLNHELYRQARKAKEEADKIARHMRRFDKTSTRARIGKAGADYLENIDRILERLEFRPVSLRTVGQRGALLEWWQREYEAGREPVVDQALLRRLESAERTNYKDISIEELRGVYGTVRSIEHLARVKNRLIAHRDKVEYEDARDEMVTRAVDENRKRKAPPIDELTLSKMDRAKETVRHFDASLLKVEQLVDWLDGEDVAGPWRKYLWEPAVQAQAAENDLNAKVTAKVMELFEGLGKDRRESLLDTFEVPSIGQKVTRSGLIAMALNTGTESSLEKLKSGGFRSGRQNIPYTDAMLEEALGNLSQADWELVQGIWGTLEELWPEIAAMEKRVTGLEPPKLDRRTVQTPYGEYRGGYYPMVYDSRFSEAGMKQVEGPLDEAGGYVRATTPKGHTKARIEGFARPVKLDLAVLPSHLAKVTKDLTHREFIIDANRLLKDPEIRGVLQERLGVEYEAQFYPWLKRIANDRAIGMDEGLGPWMRLVRGARLNATVVAMGFKATTMFSQIAGYTNSLDLVKGRYLAPALADFVRHPQATYQYVTEKSGEMRHRMNNLDRDLRDNLRRITGNKSATAQVRRFAFHGIGYFDMAVSLPTWLAAYRDSIDAGDAEQEAVMAGDRAVRLSQGAGGSKDLASVQSGSEFWKPLTMFYSYFSALYSRLRDMGRITAAKDRDVPRLLARSFFLVIAPAVLGELLAGRGPDDDEDSAAWAARKVAFYPFLTVPGLRDIMGSIESGYGYRYTPLAQAFASAARLGEEFGQVVTGEGETEDLGAAAFNFSGYFFGLPTGQIGKTGEYLQGMIEGDINPSNPFELMGGLLFGPDKDE